jgi:thiamine biosynthesis lipoprotein
MRQTRFLMGMPVIVEIVDRDTAGDLFDRVYEYLGYVDRKFSTYKEDSEISRLNRGEVDLREASDDLQGILAMAEETRVETGGYFDIRRGDRFDPSGIVKGWAIYRAAEILERAGCRNYYIYAGGDIQARGCNPGGGAWRVGIQNPFQRDEIVKVVSLVDGGIATSGTYERGAHIYNPLDPSNPLDEIVSLTVIGPNVYEADRFATAAFAMGREGLRFIEEQPGLEGYMIDRSGMASYTSGFDRVVVHA